MGLKSKQMSPTTRWYSTNKRRESLPLLQFHLLFYQIQRSAFYLENKHSSNRNQSIALLFSNVICIHLLLIMCNICTDSIVRERMKEEAVAECVKSIKPECVELSET
ncbi:uncharacterized protein [Rutidosis leptorrhynchoides]|uniref:uncharacterized protein isoform X3 n=1 Tax=Rutidosis leptorrhynchoides TaxID=125765 RepID=UPI003A998731